MTAEERIVAAVLCVAELRKAIAANGGRYSGGLAPNLQSIVDVLTIPDSVLATQDLRVCKPTPEFVEALVKGWAE